MTRRLHTVDEYCMNLVIPHRLIDVQGACRDRSFARHKERHGPVRTSSTGTSRRVRRTGAAHRGGDHPRRIAEAAGLPPDAVPVLRALWQALVAEDALLVQVNPLARTTDGAVVALDGKITLDDDATYRRTARAAVTGAGVATDTGPAAPPIRGPAPTPVRVILITPVTLMTPSKPRPP